MAAFGKQGAQVEGHRGAGRSKKHPKKTKSQIPHAKVCSRPTFPQAHPLTSLASIKITLRYGRKWPKDCIAQSIPLMCSSWWCHRAYSHEQHRPPHPALPLGKLTPTEFSSIFLLCSPCTMTCPRRKGETDTKNSVKWMLRPLNLNSGYTVQSSGGGLWKCPCFTHTPDQINHHLGL